MVLKTCSECERQLPDKTWSCPYCGNPGEPTDSEPIGKGLAPSGFFGLLVLFVLFPLLLLLIRVFIYAT